MSLPAAKPMPRPSAENSYTQENEHRYRRAIDDELGQKHDKRSDIRLGASKYLVFSATDGVEYGMGLDTDGYLTLTNYSTGDVSNFVLDIPSVAGLEQEFIDVRAEFASADGTLSASISINADAIADNDSAISTLTTEVSAARDGEASLSAKISSVETAFASADSAIAADVTALEAVNTANGLTGATNITASLSTESTARASGDSANATSITTLEASAVAASPNLLPEKWQTFDNVTRIGIGIQRGVVQATGALNQYTGAVAYKVVPNSSPGGSVYVYFGGDLNGSGNNSAPGELLLEPGQVYLLGIDMTYSAGSNPGSGIIAQLVTDGGGQVTSSQLSNDGTFVLDLSARSESRYRLRLAFNNLTSGQEQTAQFWIYGLRLVKKIGSATTALPIQPRSPKLSASVSTLREAFIDNATGLALARFVLEASASGGTPAIFSLYSDSEGDANIALNAPQIYFGDDTVFEDTHNTFYTISGSYRNRYGGPFGSSSNLLQWFGLNSVSLNSETKTNGVFAMATDGKVYFGSSPANSLTGASVSSQYVLGFASGAGSGTAGPVTVTPIGGDGTYTYAWTRINGSVLSATASTSATTSFSGTPGLGNLVENTFVCVVTETSTGRTAQVTVGAGVQSI